MDDTLENTLMPREKLLASLQLEEKKLKTEQVVILTKALQLGANLLSSGPTPSYRYNDQPLTHSDAIERAREELAPPEYRNLKRETQRLSNERAMQGKRLMALAENPYDQGQFEKTYTLITSLDRALDQSKKKVTAILSSETPDVLRQIATKADSLLADSHKTQRERAKVDMQYALVSGSLMNVSSLRASVTRSDEAMIPVRRTEILPGTFTYLPASGQLSQGSSPNLTPRQNKVSRR